MFCSVGLAFYTAWEIQQWTVIPEVDALSMQPNNWIRAGLMHVCPDSQPPENKTMFKIKKKY